MNAILNVTAIITPTATIKSVGRGLNLFESLLIERKPLEISKPLALATTHPNVIAMVTGFSK